MDRKLITKKDAAVLAAIAFVALLFVVLNSAFKPRGEVAVVSIDGEAVKEIRLSEIREKTDFEFENGVIITAENGKIYFSESNCKNKYCIGTGKLSKAGDVAVCVPCKTVIVVNGKPENADVITY